MSFPFIQKPILQEKLQKIKTIDYFTVEQLWNKLVIWLICLVNQTPFCDAAIAKSTIM
jgi:hypothetical protein